MPPYLRRRLRSAVVPAHLAMAALLLATGCSGDHTGTQASTTSGWADTSANVVSKPVIGAGVTAVTGLRGDGHLQTAVFDLATGKRLWAQPATMAGRLVSMGVQPPAVTGSPAQPLVAAVEPRQQGRWHAALVVRDARTGQQRWTRPVDTTFGPARCGSYICMSEFTARKNARFVALDPATRRPRWQLPGIAEVEWTDEQRVVLFRMARHPMLAAYDLRTGRPQWAFAVEKAVGLGVNLSGGWAFGSFGDILVGYLAPYQVPNRLSSFGFFGLRLADGRPVWTHKRLLRVYPSANPAISLITREVDDHDTYGGFTQLDPRTGRVAGQIPAANAPQTAWWLSFPSDLSTIGFLSQGHAGSAYNLRRGMAVAARGLRTWSFCTASPAPLNITGQRGFFPVAALCAYDLATGTKVAAPGAPPSWYTGAVDGWRVWRGERGVLHATHDARGTAPGMYG